MTEQVVQLYQRIWEGQPELLSAIDRLEKTIGYRFERRELLLEALTHRSMASFGAFSVDRDTRAGAVAHQAVLPGNARAGGQTALPGNTRAGGQTALPWNERLEFLGDAVLGLVVSTILIGRQEQFAEGELSRIRASLVNEDALAEMAQDIGLGAALLLGKGERKGGGIRRKSLLADALEALIGAVYEDTGLGAARTVIESLYGEKLTGALKPLLQRDFKTMLQEWTQEKSLGVPSYRVVRETGPDHSKEFVVEVLIKGEVFGSGVGDSKKRASQVAARQAFEKLEVTF